MVKKTVTKEKTIEKKINEKKAQPNETKQAPINPETADGSDIVDAEKHSIIEDFALKSGDTGSPEVQIALATHKILNLAKHLELNPKDNHSRRGLLKIISKRRRILNYLASKDVSRYKELIKRLHLKK